MEMTPRLGLPLLIAGQVQKEVFHNEALTLADLMISGLVEASPISAPPANPVPGCLYRVAPGASGAFAGRDGALAGYGAGGWRFVAPSEGMRLTDRSSGVVFVFLGGAWSAGSVRANEVLIQGVKVVGARQPAIPGPAGGAVIDNEARAAINGVLAVLRAHGLIAA